MDVQLLEPDVLFASLPAEPHLQPELKLLWTGLAEREPLHLILDLSRVEIVSSPSLGSLLLLRQRQSERAVRLVLCNVQLATRTILRVVGLDAVFEYADDRPDALRVLRCLPRRPARTSAVGRESDGPAS